MTATANRLQTATATSGAVNTTTTYAYDATGNIICKSDISACTGTPPTNYTYNVSIPYYVGFPINAIEYRVLPHLVSQINGTVNGAVNPAYTYDANGNMLTGDARTITWTSFNMPYQITDNNSATTALKFYDPDHERTEELQADGSLVVVLNPRYDTGGHFEKKYLAANGNLTGAIEYENCMYAGSLMFGCYNATTATDGGTVASTAFTYYSRDNLGSVVAMTDGNGNLIPVTDSTGASTNHLSYDPWGKRRYPNGTADPNGLLLNNPDMYHGFTGQEMMDSVALVHLNGRLYDPAIGRFVSADPMIQAPDNLQSYNRYSYGWNNPLSGTDPSGFCWAGCFWQPSHWSGPLQIVAAVAVAVYAPEISGMLGWSAPGYEALEVGPGLINTGLSATLGISSGAVATGMLGGALAGGIMGGSFQSAAFGAISGGAFGWAGDVGQANGLNSVANFEAHAAAGCLQGALGGGGCGRGALSGMASMEGAQYGFVGAMVAGGTVSVLGGGKFGNGAMTGAFDYLFNDCGVGHISDCIGQVKTWAQNTYDFLTNNDVLRANASFKTGGYTNFEYSTSTVSNESQFKTVVIDKMFGISVGPKYNGFGADFTLAVNPAGVITTSATGFNSGVMQSETTQSFQSRLNNGNNNINGQMDGN